MGVVESPLQQLRAAVATASFSFTVKKQRDFRETHSISVCSLANYSSKWEKSAHRNQPKERIQVQNLNACNFMQYLNLRELLKIAGWAQMNWEAAVV